MWCEVRVKVLFSFSPNNNPCFKMLTQQEQKLVGQNTCAESLDEVVVLQTGQRKEM